MKVGKKTPPNWSVVEPETRLRDCGFPTLAGPPELADWISPNDVAHYSIPFFFPREVGSFQTSQIDVGPLGSETSPVAKVPISPGRIYKQCSKVVSDSLEDYTLHILPFISSYTQYIPNISEDFSTFHEFHDRTLPSPSDRRWTLARRRSTRRWVPRREVFSKPRLISTGAEGNHEGSWEAQWKNWKWEKWHTFLKRERHETTPQLSAFLIRWYIYNYINTLFYPQYMFSVFLSENRTWTWSPGPRMSMAWWPENDELCRSRHSGPVYASLTTA